MQRPHPNRDAMPEPADSPQGAPATANADAFRFVQMLASELSTGRVDLPACPDVVVRMHRALSQPEVTDGRIALVVASDAGLAARILTLANSAALSRGGRQIVDLRQAVTRIGHQHTRSAAIAYAMGQIRMAETLKHIRAELAMLWQRSTLVAALAHVIALHTRAADADEAMLAGLLHNIGCVYILSRADQHSPLFTDRGTRDALTREWSPQIGRAIAENWGMAESVAAAVAEQEVASRPAGLRRDLLDVLSVAVRTADYEPAVTDASLLIAGANTFQRLGIDAPELEAILAGSASEIAELRGALSE